VDAAEVVGVAAIAAAVASEGEAAAAAAVAAASEEVAAAEVVVAVAVVVVAVVAAAAAADVALGEGEREEEMCGVCARERERGGGYEKSNPHCVACYTHTNMWERRRRAAAAVPPPRIAVNTASCGTRHTFARHALPHRNHRSKHYNPLVANRQIVVDCRILLA